MSRLQLSKGKFLSWRAASLAIVTLALLGADSAAAQQPPAQAPPQPPGYGTKTIERKGMGIQEDRDVDKYRRKDERLKAKPLDWNSTIGKPEGSPSAPEGAAPEAVKPSTAPGGKPNPKADSDARRSFPSDWRPASPAGPRSSLEGNIRLAGSPDVYTQYCEGCAGISGPAPRAIGKLFTSAGTCSASVISGNNVIVTAAHCCWNRSTNNWIGGWVFAPAYDSGNAPYGTFPWSTATVLNSWINNGDVASDVCTIRLANNSAGRSVTYYTGWLGRSWDWGGQQEHHVLGYPGNLGNGNILELCTSESFTPTAQCGGAGVLNTGCSMTFGSSGGPWIRHYRTDNWVNSVVHGYDSQSCTGTFGQTFNGARFTSANIVPVCNTAGC